MTTRVLSLVALVQASFKSPVNGFLIEATMAFTSLDNAGAILIEIGGAGTSRSPINGAGALLDQAIVCGFADNVSSGTISTRNLRIPVTTETVFVATCPAATLVFETP